MKDRTKQEANESSEEKSEIKVFSRANMALVSIYDEDESDVLYYFMTEELAKFIGYYCRSFSEFSEILKLTKEHWAEAIVPVKYELNFEQ